MLHVPTLPRSSSSPNRFMHTLQIVAASTNKKNQRTRLDAEAERRKANVKICSRNQIKTERQAGRQT